jgi:hypothetical protein
VDDAATVMGEDDEHEQQSIRHGRHNEEISGRDPIDVTSNVRQVRDGGRWWRAMYLATAD